MDLIITYWNGRCKGPYALVFDTHDFVLDVLETTG